MGFTLKKNSLSVHLGRVSMKQRNTIQGCDQHRGQLFALCNKTRAEGQEAWRKLLKHWHMREAEVGQ